MSLDMHDCSAGLPVLRDLTSGGFVASSLVDTVQLPVFVPLPLHTLLDTYL